MVINGFHVDWIDFVPDLGQELVLFNLPLIYLDLESVQFVLILCPLPALFLNLSAFIIIKVLEYANDKHELADLGNVQLPVPIVVNIVDGSV